MNLQSSVIKDFQPEDGWELLIKDFGNGSNGDASAVTNPFFALYNRYTATIRAFFLVVDPLSGTHNGATVSLSFQGPTGRNESSLLAHAFPIMNASDKFNKGTVMKTPNRYVNEQDFWLYADFPVSYDPCTCLFGFKITFNIELIQTVDANLNIKLKGTSFLKQVIKTQAGGGVQAGENQVLNWVDGLVKSGTTGYKSYEGFKTATEGISGFLTATNPDQKENISKELTGLLNFGKAIPYLGSALGVLDFFIGGGKKTATSAAVPAAFQANLTHEISGNADGTLKLSSPRGDRTIWTPGSNHTSAPTATGSYDNVLGVFSLLETPQIEYVDYTSTSYLSFTFYAEPSGEPDPYCGTVDEYGNYRPCGNDGGYYYSNIGAMEDMLRHYRLASNLKYAINPAANMDLIDLQAALVIEDTLLSGNRRCGDHWCVFNWAANFGRRDGFSSVNEKLNKLGYEFETDTRFRTPFIPASCATNTGVLLGIARNRVIYSQPLPIKRYPPNIYVKVKATFRRKNADNTTQDVLYVGTYNANIFRSPSDPGNLTFDKVKISDNDAAYQSAYYYTADRIPLPLPVEGIAGVQNPTFPSQCSTLLSPQTAQDLVSFCQNTSRYNSVNNSARISADQDNTSTSKQKKEENLLQNTPNPFVKITNIGYSVQSKGAVKLFVTDLYGRLVTTLVDNPAHETGTFTVDFSSGNLKRGLYYYTLQTSDGTDTKRLIIGE